MQLENNELLIDLGWYPHGDLEGSYKLYMVNITFEAPFQHPLEVFSSRSKTEILEKLEYWTNSGFYQKYIRRTVK